MKNAYNKTLNLCTYNVLRCFKRYRRTPKIIKQIVQFSVTYKLSGIVYYAIIIRHCYRTRILCKKRVVQFAKCTSTRCTLSKAVIYGLWHSVYTYWNVFSVKIWNTFLFKRWLPVKSIKILKLFENNICFLVKKSTLYT